MTREQVRDLREAYFNRSRSSRAKTIAIGLKQAFELLDTAELSLLVVEAANIVLDGWDNPDYPLMECQECGGTVKLREALKPFRAEEKPSCTCHGAYATTCDGCRAEEKK